MDIYLAGGIEKSEDGGRNSRLVVHTALDGIAGINLIDPCDFEYNKEYKSMGEIVAHKRNWRHLIRTIMQNDIKTVEDMDAVIAILDGTAGPGTVVETICAYRRNIPIIGYYTKDVYKNRRTAIYPWLLAVLDKECTNAAQLRKAVKYYQKRKDKRWQRALGCTLA